MDPITGVILFSIAGFSAASFYVPINKVKGWAWETYWLSMGFVAWIVAPIVGACLTTPDLWMVLSKCPPRSILLIYLFGILWGIGSLTSGLSFRYIGLSLGQSLSLGFCAVFGTLIPPLFIGDINTLFSTTSGLIAIGGIVVCLAGIAICGYAGVLKERKLTTEQKRASIKDFALVKGFIVAICGGLMSAFMAFAFQVGKPIARAALESGTSEIYQNNALLVIALAGGFTTNFLYCLFMNIKNNTIRDFVTNMDSSLLLNYILAMVSGAIWYLQFYFYGMGITKMGKFDFVSWSIFMAFIIIFSNIWGMYLKEWKLVNQLTMRTLITGLLVLIISIFLIGIGSSI